MPEELKEMLQGLTVDRLKDLKWNIQEMILNRLYGFERWEHYWYVNTDGEIRRETWIRDETDISRHKFGNCFKEAKKAQIAAEKFKALLLEMRGK